MKISIIWLTKLETLKLKHALLREQRKELQKKLEKIDQKIRQLIEKETELIELKINKRKAKKHGSNKRL
jgi:glucosamine 6-phosphate synthetase-like amidotransferase/phosphosugar isomerase protein